MKKFKLGLIGMFLLGATLVSLSPESASALESRSIIGTDDRVQITDTTAVPYQSTVFIAANGRAGSGSVIGKNTVLTAAHVVSGIKDSPNTDSSYIVPGRNGDTLPYGKFKIKEVHIPQSYLDSKRTDDDYAVLTLEPNDGKGIGDVVKQNPIVLTNTVTLDDAISSSGYPGDKPWGTQWEAKGKIIGKQTANLIDYDFDTFPGQSGSSVFNSNHEIIAVHSSGGGNRNVGVKLNSEHFNFILDHIGETSNPISAQDIVVEKEEVEVNVGESLDLKASVLPETATNKQLLWETSDKDTATVDANGRVTGVSLGFVFITVTTQDGKITKQIIVDVNEVAPEDIVVEKEEVELTVGESMTLKASVSPENTTDKELFWISNDHTIADVDDYGKVTGMKPGTTKIRVLSVTNFGDIEKFITVTVKEKFQLQPADLTFPARNGLYFSKQEIKETREVNSTPDKKANILFHLKKPNALYDLKIGELDFNGGKGTYNVQPLTLGNPLTQSYYVINTTRKVENSKLVIMYVDKKNPKIVKDYFIIEKM